MALQENFHGPRLTKAVSELKTHMEVEQESKVYGKAAGVVEGMEEERKKKKK